MLNKQNKPADEFNISDAEESFYFYEFLLNPVFHFIIFHQGSECWLFVVAQNEMARCSARMTR